jgi:hypothetical protein
MGIYDLVGHDLSGDPVVGEIKVGEVLGRQAHLQQVIGKLEEHDGLADLAWAQNQHRPPIVRALDLGEDLALEIPADGISSRAADRAISPPRILVLQKVGKDHLNAPWLAVYQHSDVRA